MKVLFVVILILLVFIGCTETVSVANEYKAVEIINNGNIFVYVFEYKGHEYLVNYQGGIIEVKWKEGSKEIL